MQFKKSCDVVDIRTKRHELPVEIILFHMVDFSKIRSLPINQDCTKLLHEASYRALDQMFHDGRYYVETFMPRQKEFEARLIEELNAYQQGEWRLCGNRLTMNDNGSSSALY